MADETRIIAFRTDGQPAPGRTLATFNRLLPIPPEGMGIEIEGEDGSDSYWVRSTVLFIDPRTGDVSLHIHLR